MILLEIFQLYLPLLLGCKYIFQQNKQHIENLLKFMVLSCLLHCVQWLLTILVQEYVVEVLLLVPYVHLTIYHYIYAADLYDVLLIPLAESLKDLVVQRLHNWHYRIRALVDPDNMFLVKEK